MKQSSVQIDRKNKTVTIVMPLEKPRPSKSTGKTKIIATTGGLRTSEETYAQQPVCFTANVFFFPPPPSNTDESGQHSATDGELQGSTAKNRGRHLKGTTADGSVET